MIAIVGRIARNVGVIGDTSLSRMMERKADRPGGSFDLRQTAVSCQSP